MTLDELVAYLNKCGVTGDMEIDSICLDANDLANLNRISVDIYPSDWKHHESGQFAVIG